jgi:hypothetical protein
MGIGPPPQLKRMRTQGFDGTGRPAYGAGFSARGGRPRRGGSPTFFGNRPAPANACRSNISLCALTLRSSSWIDGEGFCLSGRGSQR